MADVVQITRLGELLYAFVCKHHINYTLGGDLYSVVRVDC